MLYSILLVAALGALMFYGKRLSKLSPAERKRFLRQYGLWALAGVVLVLVVSGKAHWLMGVLAALMALFNRVSEFARFTPMFKSVFGTAGGGADNARTQNTPAVNDQMTRKQATEILGIDESASEEDIALAHKRLMQKLHPDRGGSDALAAQINQARSVLLGES